MVGAPPKRVKSNNLLWFVGGRTYVPLADLRRRFGLPPEDGTCLQDNEGPCHIGLPVQVAEVLVDLKQKGKLGFSYDMEHAFRIVVGVYPMRIRTKTQETSAAGISPASTLVRSEETMVEALTGDDTVVASVIDEERLAAGSADEPASTGSSSIKSGGSRGRRRRG